MLEWSSPYPRWIYLILGAGFLLLIGVARRTAISERLRRWWLFLPRLAVLLLLLMILLNPVDRRDHRLPDQPAQVQFLVDASRSMALGEPHSRSLQVQQAIQVIDSTLRRQPNHPQIQLFRFGQQLSSVADLSRVQPQDNVTRLAEALEQLPSRFSRELPRGVVVFSDGVIDDADRLDDVAQLFREMPVPIHVYPVGDAQVRGDVAIDELVVPPRVDAGVKASIRGVIRGTGYDGERVVLQVRSAARPQLQPLATLPMTLAELPQPFEMIVEANPDYGELVLEAPVLAGEVSERNNRIPFQLAKSARKLKVLYMEGTGSNEYHWVQDALHEDKDFECVSLVADQQYVQRPRMQRVDDIYRGFPATHEELMGFDCVICSDISIGAFTKEQLDWTVELVDKRGGGFMMVGGITSFGAGGWDQTVWDQLIPVDMTGGKIGRGWLYHTFSAKIPDAALTHPIWKILEDPEQNRKVLAAMPQFLGTNYVSRLKPAAVLLAESATAIPQAGIMPIIACQTYGRGRTIAFAPDTTADWGRLFESQWGEGDNRYFRRFWRNAIRWLTENSNAGNKRLQIATDRVIYRTGQPIQISCQAFDERARETIDYQLTANVKLSNHEKATQIGDSISLSPNTHGTAYTGTFETQMLVSESDDAASSVLAPCELEVVATQNGTEISRAVASVMLLPDLHELLQPRSRPDVLENLAHASNGRMLRGTADLISLLGDMRLTAGDSVVSRQPLWDRTWVWTLILFLLAIEWTLRRRSGYA